MAANSIYGDIQDFEMSVRRLSDTVGSAGVVWRDRKFSELSGAVRQVAMQSQVLMTAGERFASAISRFESVAGEKV